MRSGSDAVLTQDLVQLRLVGALPRLEAADDQGAREPELAARELALAGRLHDDAPRRHDAAGDLLALDASMLAGESFGHISIEDAIALARAARPGHALFTHVGHVKRTHADLEALVRERGGPSFDIAHDGLSVDV